MVTLLGRQPTPGSWSRVGAGSPQGSGSYVSPCVSCVCTCESPGPVEGSGGEDGQQVRPRALASPDSKGSVSGISPAACTFPQAPVPSKVCHGHFAEFSQLPGMAALTLFYCENGTQRRGEAWQGHKDGAGWSRALSLPVSQPSLTPLPRGRRTALASGRSSEGRTSGPGRKRPER